MGPTTDTETLVESWSTNADRWRDVIAQGAIASRRLATDAAIVEAVRSLAPQTILDVGCGEGWLARALRPHVASAVGFDVSPELIEHARAAGGDIDYRVASYAEVIDSPEVIGGGFEAIAINFALLDPAAGELLAALRRIAAPGGALVIQTLHPCELGGTYVDGWRTEQFTTFGAERWAPMPWYFRTFGSWLRLIGEHWRVESVTEPLNPETQRPASLLVVARV